MRCNKVKKILSAYLDGELSESKSKKVQQHLSECSTCAWELKSFQKIDELGRWMAETESSQTPRDYWENYQANLYARLEQETAYQQSNITGFLNRYWGFSLAFATHWLKRMAPGLAAAAIIIAMLTGIDYMRRQPFQTTAQESREMEKISVNLYLKEHKNAVMLTSHSTQPTQREIELGYEDVFYYDAARGLDGEWPGEAGVFLRAPRRSGYPIHKEPSTDIANDRKLSLKEVREAVSFKIIAPQILHPAYFLESIRKVKGRECLQLIYTNGISTLSLFEQALGSEERFHSGDFREYIMYSKEGGEPVNIIGWNSAEVSFTLLGEEDLSHLMSIIRAVQANYLANSGLGNEG